METLQSGDSPALLTNVEVMELLSRRIQARQDPSNSNPSSSSSSSCFNINPSSNNTLTRTKLHPQLRHQDFIERQVYQYLQNSPCATLEIDQMPVFLSQLHKGREGIGLSNPSRNIPSIQEKERTKEGMRLKQGFGLTDAEKIQILNHMPTELVELHLMLEDLQNRMEEDRQQELLDLIRSYKVGVRKEVEEVDGVEKES